MKKKIIFGIAILAIAAVAAFNVNLNTNQKSELSFLALANVEALAQDENNNGTVSKNEKLCRDAGNYWDMALVSVDGGVGTQDCTMSGEITILGVTLKGNYSKGKTYAYTWDRYSCQTSKGNCCAKDDQGTRVNAD